MRFPKKTLVRAHRSPLLKLMRAHLTFFEFFFGRTCGHSSGRCGSTQGLYFFLEKNLRGGAGAPYPSVFFLKLVLKIQCGRTKYFSKIFPKVRAHLEEVREHQPLLFFFIRKIWGWCGRTYKRCGRTLRGCFHISFAKSLCFTQFFIKSICPKVALMGS